MFFVKNLTNYAIGSTIVSLYVSPLCKRNFNAFLRNEKQMENKLTKKYGLLTAICMVVGTVVGSGIFFKAGKVLKNTNGNMLKCLVTVGGVGMIMLVCSYVFSILAQRHEKVNGIVDYSEVTCGRKFAYIVGWFMTTIYYPTITSTLAWVSAQYTCVLFGWSVASDLHLVVAAFYLIMGYLVNAISPKIAGKFQVSATFIKFVPLIIMGVVGTVVGLANGNIADAFTANVIPEDGASGNIITAMCAFAFAYEGWIITTSINSELKNSKKNLPIALVLGAIIVVGIYLLYFLGLSGVLKTDELMASGDNIPKDAFTVLFKNEVFGTIVYVFIVISCLGTMNGLMLGCCRGMYSIAIRGEGPAHKMFAQIDNETNMPHNSSIIGVALCMLWMLQWEMGFIGDKLPAIISWENDELPIISLYGLYIPIFIVMMIKGKGLNVFQRFVMPAVACVCCGFMVYSAIWAYRIQSLYYVIVFAAIAIVGMLFYKGKPSLAFFKKEKKLDEQTEDMILTYKNMLDNGEISEAEFEEKKKELIES